MLINGFPTVMVSPSVPCRVATRPANGVGTSTTAFSVVISATGWSTTTTSPSATSQRLISPSVSPSPRSGMRKSRTVSTGSVLEQPGDGIQDAVGIGKEVAFDLGGGVRHVPAADAQNRRREVAEGALIQLRSDLGAVSREPGGLVHDNHASGL